MQKIFRNTMKKFRLKIRHREIIKKKQTDFTQLWRQSPCLLKVKIHQTWYEFSQYRS